MLRSVLGSMGQTHWLTDELTGSVICEAGFRADYRHLESTFSLKGLNGKSHLLG